jgi:hypothetical protein
LEKFHKKKNRIERRKAFQMTKRFPLNSFIDQGNKNVLDETNKPGLRIHAYTSCYDNLNKKKP